MLRALGLFILISPLCLIGCGSPLTAAKAIRQYWSEVETAEWVMEQQEQQEGREGAFYGVPVLEKKLIAFGQSADAEAIRLTRSFDHRVRCSGLNAIMGIRGREGAKNVLVEHLTDPYEPIRWFCWHELNELGLLDLTSMPVDRDCLGQWKRLKAGFSRHDGGKAAVQTAPQ